MRVLKQPEWRNNLLSTAVLLFVVMIFFMSLSSNRVLDATQEQGRIAGCRSQYNTALVATATERQADAQRTHEKARGALDVADSESGQQESALLAAAAVQDTSQFAAISARIGELQAVIDAAQEDVNEAAAAVDVATEERRARLAEYQELVRLSNDDPARFLARCEREDP